MKLINICGIVNIRTSEISNYISTENMLPNKGGVCEAVNVPSGTVIEYKVGDILISNIRPYFQKIWRADRSGGCSADVLCIRAKENVESKYLYYLLSQQAFFDYVMSGAKGCKMPRGDKKQIMQWPVTLPPLEEQRKIAGILGSLDDKIELNRRINANLEAQAQALFRSWFVDFEPFRDGPFVDSELGKIPQGWKVGTLSEVADITMGQSPKGSSYNEEGDGIIFYQGRAEFGNRFPSIRLYTTEPTRIAEINSVLLSVRAPVGDINIAKNKCCIGRGLAAIKSKQGYNSFILYLLQSLKPLLEQYNGEGTVFGCINRKEIEGLPIIIPKESVINEFERIAENIDSEIKSLTTEQETLSTLRDTLLPKLMAGEIKI